MHGWLLLAGDSRFHVVAEIFVKRDRGVALPGFAEDFRDEPPAAQRSTENGHRLVILFDDNFEALLLNTVRRSPPYMK